METKAKISKGSTGFHMGFPNGYTLSVQFGRSHYCDNRYTDITDYEYIESKTVEIAVFFGNDLIDLTKNDQVIGYVPVTAIPAILLAIQNYTGSESDTPLPETIRKIVDTHLENQKTN